MSEALDTHVLLGWLGGTGRLSRAQSRVLSRAGPDSPLLVSDIILWEIAVLLERGRIRLSRPLRDWLEEATAPPLVRRCSITPAVVSEMIALHGTSEWDPADRIIVATARVHGAKLLTSDQRIIESGLVPVIE